MKNEVTGPEAGTEPNLEGNPGDAGDQTILDDSGNPPPEKAPTGDDKGGDKTPVAARSIEDLAEADANSWTVEERRKIIKAGKYGIKTQEEYDTKFGKAKTAGQPEGEVKPLPGQPKPGAKPNPTDKNGKPAAPVAGDLSFLKEALPTLDVTNPEAVVKSLKEHQAYNTRLSQRNVQLEAFYPQIQEGIISHLKNGAEGLKAIYTQMDVPIPAWLGSAAQANGGKPAAAPASVNADYLEGLKDDDFVPASAVKGMVGRIVQDAVAAALAQVDEKYQPLQESHKAIQTQIASEAAENERQVTRKQGLSDAQLHSDFWGEYHPEERLTEKADKIWAASIGPDGRILSQPHPEFGKLKSILEHRRHEYIDKAHPAASYEHYLYERFHKSGKSKELTKAAEERAKTALLLKQQQRLQPSLVNKGVNGGPAGLKGLVIPKSVEDVANMTPEQRRAFRQRANKGEFAVQNN